MHTGFWWGDPPGNIGVDNVKIDIHEVGCGGYGLDRAGSGYGQVAGACECGDEPSGSIKCGRIY